ncbi:MAG: hypothetical protein FWG90_00450 [Oscillospiraceae bacterium]|nr:hypothetical protein [Oscillospiraceae bacterium]
MLLNDKIKRGKAVFVMVALSAAVLFSSCNDNNNEPPAQTEPPASTAATTAESTARTTAMQDPIAKLPPDLSYEPYQFKLYNPLGTGIERPEDYVRPDVFYDAPQVRWSISEREDFLVDKEIQGKIFDWVDNAFEEIRLEGFSNSEEIRASVTNGYLFVMVYLWVNYKGQHVYYDFRDTVFDLYTGEQLEFSDMFFQGEEFMPQINAMIYEQINKAGETGYMPLKRDFAGLTEGGFGFYHDSNNAFSIILPMLNPYFGTSKFFYLRLRGLDTVSTIKRDMEGIFLEDIIIHETPYWNYDLLAEKSSAYEYRQGNVLYMLLTGHEGVSQEKIDKINEIMLGLLYDEDLTKDVDVSPYVELITEGEYELSEPDEYGMMHSTIRYRISPYINTEENNVRITFGDTLGFLDVNYRWYFDLDNFNLINFESVYNG